jgi:hypothetical protein
VHIFTVPSRRSPAPCTTKSALARMWRTTSYVFNEFVEFLHYYLWCVGEGRSASKVCCLIPHKRAQQLIDPKFGMYVCLTLGTAVLTRAKTGDGDGGVGWELGALTTWVYFWHEGNWMARWRDDWSCIYERTTGCVECVGGQGMAPGLVVVGSCQAPWLWNPVHLDATHTLSNTHILVLLILPSRMEWRPRLQESTYSTQYSSMHVFRIRWARCVGWCEFETPLYSENTTSSRKPQQEYVPQAHFYSHFKNQQ